MRMCHYAYPLYLLGTDLTDKLVFTSTKNRVNPCNPCLKNDKRYFYTLFIYAGLYTCNVRSPFMAP